MNQDTCKNYTAIQITRLVVSRSHSFVVKLSAAHQENAHGEGNIALRVLGSVLYLSSIVPCYKFTAAACAESTSEGI
jgi:hypothetical protein